MSRKKNLGKNQYGLGRSLVRTRFGGTRRTDNDGFVREYKEEETPPGDKLKSVTEENTIESFMSDVILSGEKLEVEMNENFVVMPSKGRDRLEVLDLKSEREIRERNEDLRELLRIPQRPLWDKSITHKELLENENRAFVEWRRHLHILEHEKRLLLTPFERNLEVWRQFWRVVERSDLLLQIVDSRNPLLFMFKDLDQYIKRVDPKKKSIVVLNKSDLLTVTQRKIWADYFTKNKINYLFYSALNELQKSIEEDSTVDVSESGPKEETDILSVLELLHIVREELAKIVPDDTSDEARKKVVGFVGYPNVGKSSTINSIIGEKCTSVSSTPGKTKHFQTMHISSTLVICDCPGLVFPSFATTKAELVCSGILPIDQIKDYMSPTAIIVQRIPKKILELTYNIKIPEVKDDFVENNELEVATLNFLNEYAISRGFTKSSQGNPDLACAAKYILKDYVNCRLVWCQPPPGHDEQEFNKENLESRYESSLLSLPDTNNCTKKIVKNKNHINQNLDVLTTTSPKACASGRYGLKDLALVQSGLNHSTQKAVLGNKKSHKKSRRAEKRS